jgi:hypothetical protein
MEWILQALGSLFDSSVLADWIKLKEDTAYMHIAS